jgi:hypothetical protein
MFLSERIVIKGIEPMKFEEFAAFVQENYEVMKQQDSELNSILISAT